MHCPRVILVFLTLLAVSYSSKVEAQQAQKPRPLAPGVLKTIPIQQDPESMYASPMPLPGLALDKYDPKTIPVDDTLYGRAHRVILYRDGVWELEFSFIGLRQAKIAVPDNAGKVENKNFWYMVYRIRNTGKTMSFKKVKDNPAFDHIKHDLKYNEPLDEKIDFRPRFYLEGSIGSDANYKRVSYRDTINPVVVYRIRQMEDPNQRLLDSHQMSKVQFPIAKNDTDPGVWGVAIWEDVDPRIDYVSVFVHGLSNAYKLSPQNAPSKMKTLQLNFWRPGDVIAEKRDRVKYGIPLVDEAPEQINICKRYRLPGPVFKVYEKNKLAERNLLVAEIDGQINFKDLDSGLVPPLDDGKLPKEIFAAISQSGFKIDQNVAVKTEIPKAKWNFSDGGRDFVIELQPQFWEPDFGKIRFIKSLDHLWIYR